MLVKADTIMPYSLVPVKPLISSKPDYRRPDQKTDSQGSKPPLPHLRQFVGGQHSRLIVRMVQDFLDYRFGVNRIIFQH
jgi:hypothetical protein